MKIALVQDWLTGMRGGEKVLEKLCGMFPDAPVYTMVHVPGSVSDIIEDREIRKSLLNYIPLGKKYYRYFLPVMPLLVEGLNVKQCHLVVSTSHCVAKNVKPGKQGVHICYCHTPMRYIWDMFNDYFSPRKSLPVYLTMKLFRPLLKYVDVKTAGNVDYFIANSRTVKHRINKYYKRQSEVIYPPVETGYYTPGEEKEDFYLIVSSLVPYKKVDIAVKAFNKNGKKLKIIGSGPEEKYLRKIAKSNISFEGWASRENLRENYRKAKALIFPGKEDFGIVPVEAMACSTPVIAYNRGGATETVVDNITGIFFNSQCADSLNRAVEKFESMEFNKHDIRAQAEKFSSNIFMKKIKKFLKDKTRCFQ